ncbi:4-hydroxy-2-oxovalerate aldolase [Virgisporangium aurantiacum]|uniref:4-hydroxy-2-oxovalerate aldolase n=1 Tax=Virgisporangium aurantiacum TaxID=175570 RepID=A0A8J4E5L3_9ACTN|nr:4-hydroxy-2-oxovalerate aldolase [Virgisporangium aurantiacum]
MVSADVMDCTLRDGSYAVGFQFAEGDIHAVLTGLDAAGIRLVELGHGLGLGAAGALGKPMLVPEERCFELAAGLRRAAWGMFCIPGIATLSHLRRAAAAGMRFVRVGVDITDVTPAERFVETAKGLGLLTFANLMKTNVLDADGVGDAAQQCEKYGADAVYLVDSAGAYLPDEVRDLVAAVGQRLDVPLGFHGHDNLGLANANALAAAAAGARYIDTTLDGIGRGAGNAVTECFAAIVRDDAAGGYDYRALAQLSETVVRPLARLHDDRVYQVMGAVTRTHSSFFPLISGCARAAGVDAFELMAEVADVDRIAPTEGLVREIAGRLAARLAAR